MASFLRTHPVFTHMRGPLWMLGSAGSFALMWGFIRYASQDVHSTVIVFLRYVIGAALVLLVYRNSLASVLDRTHLKSHLHRSLTGVIAAALLYYAISSAPMATVLAITYTQPLFTTIGAVLFLGERIRIRRILALVVGFIGVMIVLRPGQSPISAGLVAALLAAILSGAAFIQIKQLTDKNAMNTIVAWSFILPLPVVFILALPYWTWPQASSALAILCVGLTAYSGQVCMVRAFNSAEMTAIMPYDFIRFIMVTLIGINIFSERFDIITILGGTVIFASTLYLAYRDNVAARAKAAGAPPA